jgi:hypothetical protein
LISHTTLLVLEDSTVSKLNRSAPLVVLSAALLIALSACGANGVGDHIPGEAAPATAPLLTDVPDVTSPQEPRSGIGLGPAPDDLRSVEWASSTLPGDFCDVSGLLVLQAGEVAAESATWGEVLVEVLPDENSYGDIDGDGREDAAVAVLCDSGGRTGSSVLRYGFIVVADHDSQLEAIGAVVPQVQPEDAYAATELSVIEMGDGRIVVDEHWYRHEDATCCPTGRATTKWTLQNGQLQPGRPVITQ